MRCLVAWLLVLCLGLPAWAGQAAPEVRGVWVHTDAQFSSQPAKGKAQVAQLVQKLMATNFNLVLAWAPSYCLAAVNDKNYRRFCPNAAWDALGELVRQSRAAGLAVHLWYSPVAYKGPGSPEFHTAQGGDKNWAAVRRPQAPPPKEPAQTNLCLVHPGARAWTLGVLGRALARYEGLGGVHLEEPGYSRPGFCVCGLCRKTLEQRYGPGWAALPPSGPQCAELKCSATGSLVGSLHRQLALSPITLSANGGSDAARDRALGRDWLVWARRGWLDFYVAQIYKSDMTVFERRARRVLAQMAGAAPVALGLGVSWSGGENPPQTILAQIDFARALGAAGVVLFHSRALSPELLSALADGPFLWPAALPIPDAAAPGPDAKALPANNPPASPDRPLSGNSGPWPPESGAGS